MSPSWLVVCYAAGPGRKCKVQLTADVLFHFLFQQQKESGIASTVLLFVVLLVLLLQGDLGVATPQRRDLVPKSLLAER